MCFSLAENLSLSALPSDGRVPTGKKKKKGGVEAAFCALTPEYRKPRSVGKVTYWPISKTFGRKKKMHLLLDGGIFSAPSAMLLKWHPAAMLLSRRR